MENENNYLQEQKQKKRRLPMQYRFLSGMVAGMVLALLVVGLGIVIGIRHAGEENKNTNSGISFIPDAAVSPELISKLQALEITIDRFFYLDKKSGEELREGICKGMLEALDDPYTEYYTPAELTELMNQVSGIYYGIGAYVSMDQEVSLPKISGIISNTPAEEAGLRKNDLIYQVGEVSTYGLSLDEAVSYIRGDEGTEVVLTIIREGESDYLEVPVTRRRVESPTVEYEMMEDGIGYIQIAEFDEVTPDQFADALATLRGSGMEKLIIDLRGNPGGSLTDVVDIAGMLLPEGLIVYTEDKAGNKQEYFSDGTKQLDIPLAVLVDGNSASASEILAGAIQDYGAGKLVGTTTFGKGIVQQLIPFKDGSAVKITVSSYFTPKGRNIHGIGIEPDVVCEFDGKAYYSSEEHPDNQLEKAKEVLNNE